MSSVPANPVETYYLKVGDRKPVLEITVLDDDGAVRDLTGLINAKLVVAPCVAGRRIVDAASMTFNADRATGKVSYSWGANELPVAGEYLLEVILDSGLAGQESYPRDTYHRLVVLPHL